jgi:hypothetical protein
MEEPKAAPPLRIYAWLPYWAVFQTDVKLTCQSWVYRLWVLVSVAAAVGYLLYRFGIYHVAGVDQKASDALSDLLRWTVYGSLSLIVILAVAAIAAERGTLADSVLSRGISRYQYFLAKWHARTVAVVCTFWIMGTLVLISSQFLLHEDLTLSGSLVALLMVSALLAVVVAAGVTIGALAHSTLVGVTVLWITLYGAGFLLAHLPGHTWSPDRVLGRLPNILRGLYDLNTCGTLLGLAAVTAVVAALVGMVLFARRDV